MLNGLVCLNVVCAGNAVYKVAYSRVKTLSAKKWCFLQNMTVIYIEAIHASCIHLFLY